MPKVAKETNLKYVLLGFLNHEPLSGYDLKKRIESGISYFWKKVGYSQIYPMLKKLEKQELIRMKIEKDGKRPDKKVYLITTEGKKELHNWVSIPIKIIDRPYGFSLFQEFLLKIYFGGITSKDNSLDNIASLKIWLSETLKAFSFFERRLNSIMDENPDNQYYYLALLFGKSIYESLEKWADDAVKILEK